MFEDKLILAISTELSFLLFISIAAKNGKSLRKFTPGKFKNEKSKIRNSYKIDKPDVRFRNLKLSDGKVKL